VVLLHYLRIHYLPNKYVVLLFFSKWVADHGLYEIDVTEIIYSGGHVATENMTTGTISLSN